MLARVHRKKLLASLIFIKAGLLPAFSAVPYPMLTNEGCDRIIMDYDAAFKKMNQPKDFRTVVAMSLGEYGLHSRIAMLHEPGYDGPNNLPLFAEIQTRHLDQGLVATRELVLSAYKSLTLSWRRKIRDLRSQVLFSKEVALVQTRDEATLLQSIISAQEAKLRKLRNQLASVPNHNYKMQKLEDILKLFEQMQRELAGDRKGLPKLMQDFDELTSPPQERRRKAG